MNLEDIRRLLIEDGDLPEQLVTHKHSILSKIKDYETVINTIDNTISVIEGEAEMDEKALFKGFSEEEQKKYAAEAREQFGTIVDESMSRWNSHSKDEQQEIISRGGVIIVKIAEGMDKEPEDSESQLLVKEYHEYMQVFYDCTFDIFYGLSQLYLEDNRFYKFYADIKPGLPEYLSKAMDYYCKHAIGSID